MGGQLAPGRVRKTVVLWQETLGWLGVEATRLNLTANHVIRAAIALYRAQPESVRDAVARSEAARGDGQ